MKKLILIMFFTLTINIFAGWTTTGDVSYPAKSLIYLNDKIYAGTYGGGVQVFDLFSSTWSEQNNNLGNLFISDLIEFKGDLYAATDAGVYKSNGGSSAWEKISNTIGGLTFTSLTKSDKAVYVANNNNFIYFTTDAGKTWSEVNNTDISYDIKVIKFDNNKLYAGAENGKIYMTTNNGDIWNEINNPPLLFTVTDIAFYNGKIIVGTKDGGVFRSDDGLKWKSINNGLSSSQIFEILKNDTYLFIATKDQGVYYSKNDGDTWIQASDGLGKSDVYSLLVYGQNIYVGAGDNNVYKRALSDFQDVILEAPTLTFPENLTEDAEIDLSFNWEQSKGAIFYQLQVSKQNDFANNVINIDNLSKNNYKADKLDYETTYFWRVGAVGSNNEVKWSEVRQFKTKKFVNVNEEQDDLLLNIFPNPCNEFIVINHRNNFIGNFSIYNLSGQIKKSSIIALYNSLKIDVSDLENGTYFVISQINNKIIKKKFIIKR